MSSKKRGPRHFAKKRSVDASQNQVLFTSSTGATAVLKPLPPMLLERLRLSFEEERPKPKPPTYEVKTAVEGHVEVHEHTAESAETPEEKAAWRAYADELSDWNDEFGRRFLRMVQFECIEQYSENGDSPDSWLARQQMYMKVPEIVLTDPMQKHLWWIESVLLGGQEDVLEVIMTPLQLATNLSEEDRKAAEDMFRGAVQGEAVKALSATRS